MPFPRTEEEIDQLLQIWLTKLEPHKTRYGLTTAQIAQVSDDALMYRHLRLAKATLDEDVSEFFTYKQKAMEGDPKATLDAYPTIEVLPLPGLNDAPKPGIEKRNQELYNYLKGHPNRSEESLAELGIADVQTSFLSPDDLTPAIGGKALIADQVELSFNRQGQKACRFEMRRGGGDWVKIGDPTEATFIDETASIDGKPEKREYRGVYLKNNKPFGQYSQILTIYTTP